MSMAALGLAASLAITGCDQSFHPGAAAVVDGTTISEDQLDDVVTSVCNYLEIANETSQTPSTPTFAELKASFLGVYIQLEVVRGMLDSMGLTVNDADIEALASQFTIPPELDDDDAQVIDDYLRAQAENQLGQATIAAHLDDPSVTDSSDVDPQAVQGATKAVAAAMDEADIEVNPSFGTWDGQGVTAGSGSLSTLVSQPEPADGEPADTSDLPPSQVCS